MQQNGGGAAPFDLLGGRRVLIALEDRFHFSYLRLGMLQWGVESVGPLLSADELIREAELPGARAIACVSVNLPGLHRATETRLLELSIPYILFGIPATPTAAMTTMRWPFSAWQVAYELAALVTSPREP